jgi:ferritin-like metal-binding protein YciE
VADSSAGEIIGRYLQDAVAAENSFADQLWAFSREGDDSEVQSLFATHARETQLQSQRLTARLAELGGTPSTTKSVLAHLFGVTPRAAQLTHTPEERLAQNLVIAYSVEMSECAMYEALASVAAAAGDSTTEQLARQIQEEERQTSAKVWSFVRSRAKIAFNLLTAGEMDPAVETRMADDRLL